MKKGFVLLTIILTFFFVVSCSKEDDSNSTTVQDGGAIMKHQLVTIEMPDTVLDNAEYYGTLAGEPVTLYKGGENVLLFFVDSYIPTGNRKLVVEDLGLTIRYTVETLILPSSPDQVLSEFFQNENAFLATLESSPEEVELAEDLNWATAEYNNLTEEEKLLEAEVYYANKELFNEIMLNNPNLAGRNAQSPAFASDDNLQLIEKFRRACELLFKTDIIGRSLPAARIIQNIKAIRKGEFDIIILFNKLKACKLIVQSLEVNNNNIAHFVDGSPKTLTVTVTERDIESNDSGNPKLNDIFTNVSLFNATITSVNNLLSIIPGYTNIEDLEFLDNNPLFTRDLTQLEFNSKMTSNQTSLDLDNYSDFSSALFISSGQIRITANINPQIGMVSFPLTGKLDWTYDDGISLKDVYLDVTLTPKLAGSWSLYRFENTVTPGAFTNLFQEEGCAEITIIGQYTYNSSNMSVSNNNTFTVVTTITTNYNGNYCNGSPPDSGTTVGNVEGTYLFDEADGKFKGTTEDEGVFPFEFIEKNKFRINHLIYTRN